MGYIESILRGPHVMFWQPDKMVYSLLRALYWLLGTFVRYRQCIIKMFARLCKDEETARTTDGFSKENCFRKARSHFGQAQFVLWQDAFKIRCRRVTLELYPNECWANYPIHWSQPRTGEASSILLCFYRRPQSKSDPKPTCAVVWAWPIKCAPGRYGR